LQQLRVLLLQQQRILHRLDHGAGADGGAGEGVEFAAILFFTAQLAAFSRSRNLPTKLSIQLDFSARSVVAETRGFLVGRHAPR
jgi:hypothetical protein